MKKETGYFQVLDRPIVIYKRTLKEMQKEANWENLYALLSTMISIADEQGTNQIWANSFYLAKGMQWSERKVLKYRKQLEDLGYIRTIRNRNKHGILGKKFIQLKYVGTQRAFAKMNPEGHYGQVDETASRPFCHDGETAPLNALREFNKLNSKKKCLKISKYHSFTSKDGERFIYFHPVLRYYANIFGIKRNPPVKHSIGSLNNPDNKFFIYLAKRISKINERYHGRKFKNWKGWVNDIRKLSQVDFGRPGTPPKETRNLLRMALQYYEDHIGEQFCPVIESGKSFREKFTKLERAIQRERDRAAGKYNGNEPPEGKYLTGNHFIIHEPKPYTIGEKHD